VSWAVRLADQDLLGFMNVAIRQAELHGIVAAVERKYNLGRSHWHPKLSLEASYAD
jgi:hypothetical protein